jgi:CHAT domain-containing protein/lipopolysaccharide biosynthesis regulator YciM
MPYSVDNSLPESRQIGSTLDEEVQQARETINKANVLENLDRFADAIALLEQARTTLADHERSLEVACTDLNLGVVYTRLGRYDEALAALDRAEKGFAALDNPVEAAVVELYRADLYADFNLYEELLQAPGRDWTLFEERQMQWQAARAALHKAVAWRKLGDVTQAGELLAGARAIFARIGDPVWARLADQEQATLWCEMGEWTRALPVAVETAALLRDRGRPIRAGRSSLLAAQCCLALDQLTEATRHYQEVLKGGLGLNNPALLYRAHHGLGRVAQRQGHLEDAYEHFHQAIETLESIRQRLHVDDFRVGFPEDRLHVYRDAMLLCLQVGRDEETFAYVERAKSGELVNLLIASLASSPALPHGGREKDREGAREDLIACLKTLREQLHWHYSKFSAKWEGGDGEKHGRKSSHPEAAVWQRISVIEQEAAQAWWQLQWLTPSYASLSRSDLCTPAAVRTCLREGEVLLQYYVAGETIYVFIVGHDGLRACLPLACTPSQVEDGVGALEITLKGVSNFGHDYVATTLDPLSRQQLSWLYDDLLRPIVPFLEGANHLLVAPDGLLFKIPFHALHDGEVYLLERYQMSYTPSASALRLCQANRRRHRVGPDRALVVGYSRGGELPCILQEVKAVAGTVPGAMVLTDEEATLDRLREQAGRSALLHLATHAVFRQDNPLFSALQLAGGCWLRTMDLYVYTLQLNGALVTLSGCETGRHRLRGGDLLGLSQGFFCAGASALVASLWPVGDVSTARLMERFYTHLAAGEAAVSALRRAQQELRNFEEERDGRRVRPYAHPFYWAPFCLLGTPDVRLA